MNKRIGLFMAALAALQIAASAHSLWINVPTHDLALQDGEPSVLHISLGYGELFPFDEPLATERLAEFLMKQADGMASTITVQSDGYRVGELSFDKVGAYLFGASATPVFWSRYLDAAGEEVWVEKTKDALADHTNGLACTAYHMHATTLINVHTPDGLPATTTPGPFGHPLELVLDKNPASTKVGDSLPIRILVNGQPPTAELIAKLELTVDYVGFPSVLGEKPLVPSVDEKGLATIPITRPGVWRVSTSVELPAPEADKSRIDTVYHGAVLTFGIAAPVPEE